MLKADLQPLIDSLRREGILTSQEARELRAEILIPTSSVESAKKEVGRMMMRKERVIAEVLASRFPSRISMESKLDNPTIKS